jgi:hypothetical protein
LLADQLSLKSSGLTVRNISLSVLKLGQSPILGKQPAQNSPSGPCSELGITKSCRACRSFIFNICIFPWPISTLHREYRSSISLKHSRLAFPSCEKETPLRSTAAFTDLPMCSYSTIIDLLVYHPVVEKRIVMLTLTRSTCQDIIIYMRMPIRIVLDIISNTDSCNHVQNLSRKFLPKIGLRRLAKDKSLRCPIITN